ncbi:MAG: hypothetical protein NC124_02495 [Clostridium sp.]|nr:hypothetical protein [Clostridium sp.]
MTKYTTYRIATKWLNNSYILANDVQNEEGFWDECRFETYNEENDCYIDLYQFYITDASLGDVEYLEKNFGLKFSYSNNLDCFVLCVDHYGTGWDYVSCECSDELIEINPGIEYTDSCNPPLLEITRKFIAGGKK